MSAGPRARMRALAGGSLERGDPTGWFETLYAEADGDPGAISWADLEPNPRLLEWLDAHPLRAGTTALVPGSGLGDDAALLARRGARVTAFDVSRTATGWARRRHPDADVEWVVADLLALPAGWRGAFALVAEVYTLQCLPAPERAVALGELAAAVAPGGRLVAIGRLRDEDEEPDGPPWPLALGELEGLERLGLRPAELLDAADDEDPPVRRFVATYDRPA